MVRPTGPRVFGVLVAIALVGYTFVLAPGMGLAARRSPAAHSANGAPGGGGSVTRPVFPPVGKDFIGVTTQEGAYDFTSLDAFTKAARYQPAVMMVSEGWVGNTFDRSTFDKISGRGMMPMISWEPWNYKADTVSKDGTHAVQPAYKLSRITEGDYDTYIRAYAKGVKSLGYDVAIRLAHEMNGFWYPWGVNVNGNQPGDYVKMWRHVHDIFTSVGAKNVIWVWSPNVNSGNKTRLASLYPGDDYVDWLGLSGYYGTAGTQSYRSPDAIFDGTINELRTFTNKPLVITETAATDVAGLRVQWIHDFAAYLPKHPDIIGFIWYEAIRETDWRIVSSVSGSAAFADLAANARFAVTWSPDVLPRLTVDVPGSTSSPTPNASGTPTRTNTAPIPSASRHDGNPTPTKSRPTSPATTTPPATPAAPPTTPAAPPTTPAAGPTT